jgi:hypothetical protein
MSYMTGDKTAGQISTCSLNSLDNAMGGFNVKVVRMKRRAGDLRVAFLEIIYTATHTVRNTSENAGTLTMRTYLFGQSWKRNVTGTGTRTEIGV